MLNLTILRTRSRLKTVILLMCCGLVMGDSAKVAFADGSRSPDELFPVEERLPDRNVQASILEKSTSILAHTSGFAAASGLSATTLVSTFYAIVRAAEWWYRSADDRLEWGPSPYYHFVRMFTPVIAGAGILGAFWGMFEYYRGTFSVEVIDQQLIETLSRNETDSGTVPLPQIKTIFDHLVAEATVLYPHSASYHWRLEVAEDDSMATLECYPGGLLKIYSGMLNTLDNEARVAAVLAHGMAHSLVKHVAKQMKYRALGKRGMLMAASVTYAIIHILIAVNVPSQYEPNQVHSGLSPIITSMINEMNLQFVEMPYSLQYEKQADLIDLVLMARAGYDPHEAVSFWDTLAAHPNLYGKFSAMHPSTTDRKFFLAQFLPEVAPVFAMAPRHIGFKKKLVLSPKMVDLAPNPAATSTP